MRSASAVSLVAASVTANLVDANSGVRTQAACEPAERGITGAAGRRKAALLLIKAAIVRRNGVRTANPESGPGGGGAPPAARPYTHLPRKDPACRSSLAEGSQDPVQPQGQMRSSEDGKARRGYRGGLEAQFFDYTGTLHVVMDSVKLARCSNQAAARRAGSNRRRSTWRVEPSTIGSAMASPLAGALRMPQTLCPGGGVGVDDAGHRSE